MLPRLAPALLLLAACKFPYPPDVADDDAPDAARECEANTIACDDARGEYVACSAAGTVDVAMVCPLGCAPDEEKCLDIDPHNGLAMYLDMVPNPPDLILNGPATIDTRTGTILDGAIGVTVPTFDRGGIRVYVVGAFRVEGPLMVKAQISNGLAIVATKDIEIHALVDISATGGTPGAGGDFPFNQSGNFVCVGESREANPPTPSAGAGGAGGFHQGGPGGQVQTSVGGQGGTVATSVEPLHGGCAGGDIVSFDSSNQSVGGAGGGAIQLSSRASITISGQGRIDASGGGATSGLRNIGGAGGGGGGTILLEAPQVILDGVNVVVSTKGGGGAGASNATRAMSGSDGGLDAAPAPGGTSPVQSTGGFGGTASVPSGGADAGGGGVSAGGGGGAAGITAVLTTVGHRSAERRVDPRPAHCQPTAHATSPLDTAIQVGHVRCVGAMGRSRRW